MFTGRGPSDRLADSRNFDSEATAPHCCVRRGPAGLGLLHGAVPDHRGHALVGDFFDLRAQGGFQCLGGHTFGGHAVEHEELRTAPHQAIARPHAVGQPLVALRQGPFEPGAAVTVKDSGQHREGERIVVLGCLRHRGQARHLESQRHIALLSRRLEIDAAQALLHGIGLRLALRHSPHRQAAIVLFGQHPHLLGVNIARHHHDGVGRGVPALVKITRVLWGHGLQIAHPAYDGTAVGRGTESGRGQHLMQQGTRVVFGAQPALFLDDFDFLAKLFVGPLVVGKTVGFELHHFFEAAGRDLLKVAGVVLGSESVFSSAECRHAARELARRQPGGALEHHVFEHMGHTAGAIDFVHRPDTHPDHVHRRGGAAVRPDPQLHAVGQGVGIGAAGGLRAGGRRRGQGLGRGERNRRQQGGHQHGQERQAGFHKMDDLRKPDGSLAFA